MKQHFILLCMLAFRNDPANWDWKECHLKLQLKYKHVKMHQTKKWLEEFKNLNWRTTLDATAHLKRHGFTLTRN